MMDAGEREAENKWVGLVNKNYAHEHKQSPTKGPPGRLDTAYFRAYLVELGSDIVCVYCTVFVQMFIVHHITLNLMPR